MSSTRSLQHEVRIKIDPDGSPHWDHSDDRRTRQQITQDQMDTIQMLYDGYTSAKHANVWAQEDKAAALARCQRNPLIARKQSQWERDAEATERMLKESAG